MHNIGDNLKKVINRIHNAALTAQRDPDHIHLLAVSKKHSAEAIEQAFTHGQRCFGENYLQEALDKQQQLSHLPVEWHYIGPIQSNKTRALAEHFHWVHSVDRVKIAQRLNDQRPRHLGPLQVCIQVNVDNESTKSGVHLNDINQLARVITQLPNLRLRGLMAIPAKQTHRKDQQLAFIQVTNALTHLRDDLAAFIKPTETTSTETAPADRTPLNEHMRRDPRASLDTLSMGMSSDLEAAILSGATIVRVGTDIFGPRPQST